MHLKSVSGCVTCDHDEDQHRRLERLRDVVRELVFELLRLVRVRVEESVVHFRKGPGCEVVHSCSWVLGCVIMYYIAFTQH